jgi:hypothetical protein
MGFAVGTNCAQRLSNLRPRPVQFDHDRVLARPNELNRKAQAKGQISAVIWMVCPSAFSLIASERWYSRSALLALNHRADDPGQFQLSRRVQSSCYNAWSLRF